MAGRRLVVLLLASLVAGCGAVPEPGPPEPPAEVVVAENHGALKAATWRSAAERAAAREARRQAAIRRARESTTVTGALRLARLTRRLAPAAHGRLTRELALARAALGRLDGVRAAELGSVLATVYQLAAQRLLSHDRLEPVFLVLRRNRELWTRAPMPAPGERRTFGRDPAVFQYYPGRGIQLHPLASWGTVNWLAGTCLEGRCPVKRLRRAVDRLAGLAARRGPFLAWEHYFAWGGGTAPWISGMTQATAVSALARAGRALHEPRWHRIAHRALGAFQAPPPLGVDGGDHFLMYSFAPSLRIFNGELQAVNGLGEVARLARDRTARRLFRRGELTTRRMVAAADTGAWSLYSAAGREATLSYHQLIAKFLRDMCAGTERRVYCAAARRFSRYEREPTRIGVAPLRRLHARRATTVRFSISKVSAVKVRVFGRRGLAYRRDLELAYGAHQVAWTPPARGRFRLRIEAQGPSGPVGVVDRRLAVRLPRPKPEKKERPKRAQDGPRSATPGNDRKTAPDDEVLTPRTEREKVSS
jgi:D-glucuronyl C5-epimerase C-terminus